MNSPEAPLPPEPVSAGPLPSVRRLSAVFVPVAFTTFAADFLFWRSVPGISVGILTLILDLLLLLARNGRACTRWTLGLGVLLAVAILQAAVELSFSNVLAITGLILALGAECFQSHLPSLWARWSESVYGVVTAPFRWLQMGWRTIEAVVDSSADAVGRISKLAKYGRMAVRALWVGLPAAGLLLVFGIVFSSGNAVFREIMDRSIRSFTTWLLSFDFSIGRLVFWAALATLALGLFHGTRAPDAPRWWTYLLPRLPRRDQPMAAMQSAGVLIALNALFCLVNTIDVIYLWSGGGLPKGVSHSEFVHAGVWSLISAVVLSAIVIAGIFQQQDGVIARRWLKNLAHFWVLQNGLLIAGVFLRLRMYVEEFQFSEKRIYVGCFLLLVGAGFGLLAVFVERRRSLNWLLGTSALATFALFFTLQFTDVAGFVARANVAQWKREPVRGLDVEYLSTLGPTAWAALIEVAESPTPNEPRELARAYARSHAEVEAKWGEVTDWRSWQYRRASLSDWFIQKSRALPESKVQFNLGQAGRSEDAEGASIITLSAKAGGR